MSEARACILAALTSTIFAATLRAQDVDAWLREFAASDEVCERLRTDSRVTWLADTELRSAVRVPIVRVSQPDARAHAERLACDVAELRARLGVVVHEALSRTEDVRLPWIMWRVAAADAGFSVGGTIGPGMQSDVRVIGDDAVAIVRAPREAVVGAVAELPDDWPTKLYRKGLRQVLVDLEGAKSAPKSYLDVAQEAKRIGLELTNAHLVGIATAFVARGDGLDDAKALADHLASLEPPPAMDWMTWLALADVERALGRVEAEARALRTAEQSLDRDLGLRPIGDARAEDFLRAREATSDTKPSEAKNDPAKESADKGEKR